MNSPEFDHELRSESFDVLSLNMRIQDYEKMQPETTTNYLLSSAIKKAAPPILSSATKIVETKPEVP
jgi:hypothetical protein